MFFRRPLRLPAIPARTVLAALLFGTVSSSAVAQEGFEWSEPFLARIAQVDEQTPGRLGVYVKDMETGISISYHGEEPWYLASTVKVPVAITVMRQIEEGALSLETTVPLLVTDYVDGAGATNGFAAGTALSVHFLMEQMLIHSDNTASDMLIRLVGLERVNAVTRELVPEGFGPITSLADVRRRVYSELHPAAQGLSGNDFLALKRQPSEAGRLTLLARLLGVERRALVPISLGEAYERYYATPYNSATLKAYGDLLSALDAGTALNPVSTQYLLGVMRRAQTGALRIKAGLPPKVGFAHKTGTQRARICDAGLIDQPSTDPADTSTRLVVIACVREVASTPKAERALRGTGEAVVATGLIRR
ncbi:serine hydrolase [Stutzerimonas sp. NM35]|uniref:serine hydrolase n=1 Tax=Stutzerimonas stutzeri TaxID=316 RepID=UPI0015E38DD2|nr:serine hydrolase [Stutzerimonas stutzeri]MBA1261446.1 serine hydrolase [Stutzerimonas stutzeri]